MKRRLKDGTSYPIDEAGDDTGWKGSRAQAMSSETIEGFVAGGTVPGKERIVDDLRGGDGKRFGHVQPPVAAGRSRGDEVLACREPTAVRQVQYAVVDGMGRHRDGNVRADAQPLDPRGRFDRSRAAGRPLRSRLA